MHIKVIKSYITDIDAREFKEFDDELDVDVVKVEKKDSIILLLLVNKSCSLYRSGFVIFMK